MWTLAVEGSASDVIVSVWFWLNRNCTVGKTQRGGLWSGFSLPSVAGKSRLEEAIVRT